MKEGPVENKCFIYRSKDEKVQQSAMKLFYEKASKSKNTIRVKQCKTFLRIIYPSLCLIFIGLFWSIGLINYFK